MTFSKIILFTIVMFSGQSVYSHESHVTSPVTADIVILSSVGDVGSINLIFDFLGNDHGKPDVVDMLYIMMDKSVSDINHYFKEITVSYVRESACNLSVELMDKIKIYEDLDLRRSIKKLHYICEKNNVDANS